MSSIAAISGGGALNHLSTEYVKVRVKALNDSNVQQDPTASSVWMAFVDSGSDPGASDWNVGSWGTATIEGETHYLAKCLVGPNGTFVPSASSYPWACDVYVKVEDLPETPVVEAGPFTFE